MISQLITVVTSLFLLVTIVNLFTARTIKESASEITDSVVCLIPMRNESVHAREVVQSALAQTNLHKFQVIALDDHSTDSTREELSDIAAPNFRWFSGEHLPPGWLGKNFACHQLAQSVEADVLVFLDADTRLTPGAISSSIGLMERWQLDFISPYPRQIAITFLEKIVQPLLQWSWFASVPLRLAERFGVRSMAVANGQFFIVKSRAYREAGGHQAIRGEVLDDIYLARSLVSAGFRGCVADGSKVAYCRMYKSARELIDGYAKSQWRAFGNLVGAIIMVLILIMTSIAPLIAGVLGYSWGWYGFLAIVTTRIAVALKTRSSLLSSFLHPLSALMWIGIIKLSWYRKFRGSLEWRGRAL